MTARDSDLTNSLYKVEQINRRNREKKAAATAACDVLNLALQDAPEIGHEYGYGDLAHYLIAALRGAGYAITRESLCARSGGCR